MVERIGEQVDDIVNQQRLLRISEIKALQAQINPHFLYNTLNSIKSMAKLAGAANVALMVTNLGKILRNGFTPGEDFMTIEKSLETARCYFDIESFRWEGRFTFVEHIDPRILDCSLPRLVLQPLVENALIHGLERKPGPGTLTVQGELDGHDIRIDVIDDGCGIPAAKLASLREFLSGADSADPSDLPVSLAVSVPTVTADAHAAGQFPSDSNGIALANTHRRLVLLYGPGYGLEIFSTEGQGTCISVRIPFRMHTAPSGDREVSRD
jgi:two-component system sensor histidine kinase YesM